MTFLIRIPRVFFGRFAVIFAARMSTGPAKIGSIVAERYRIESLLGRGGMATVYRARHLMLDRTVAVKLLKSEAVEQEEARERFRREAQAASRIEHPNITQVLDFGQTKGIPFLIMEYVDGPSLSRLLDEVGDLPAGRVIPILRQMAEALRAAHEQDVVHRDLKPDNIALITQGTRRDHVKILDFGLAKILGPEVSRLTATGMVFGTPHYMSPEQATATPVDHRTDIYSLGVVAYELLAGQPPFVGAYLKVIQDVVFTEPLTLTSVAAQPVSPELEALIMRCIAKDPDRRFGDAAALLEALSALDG
jgi:serine/threonine-protein kinase